jgi:hypothetical protein
MDITIRTFMPFKRKPVESRTPKQLVYESTFEIGEANEQRTAS